MASAGQVAKYIPPPARPLLPQRKLPLMMAAALEVDVAWYRVLLAWLQGLGEGERLDSQDFKHLRQQLEGKGE